MLTGDQKRSNSNMTFQSEQCLVDELVSILETDQTPWGRVDIGREFDYSRGRTDVLAISGSETVIAIEAKLQDWKCALQQAYRNTCFANRSFVLLPKEAALAAAVFGIEFERRNVGLCYIDGTNLIILCDSPSKFPIEPWLASQAISQVRQSNTDICQIPPIA